MPPPTCSERFDLSLIQRCKNPPALLPQPAQLFDLQLLESHQCHWIKPPRRNRRAPLIGRALKYHGVLLDPLREMVHPASSSAARLQTSAPQLLFVDSLPKGRRRLGAVTLKPLRTARLRPCYAGARRENQ